MFKAGMIVLVAGTVAGTAGSVAAAEIDLTAAGSFGVVNGAHFFTNEDQPTGTGVFQPFVRIQRTGMEQGYNTSASSLPFDEKPGPWTRDMRLSELGTVVRDGVMYFDFRLDINESNGGSHPLLSLDKVQIYTSGIGGQNTTDVASLGVLRYDLDAGGNNSIKLNYDLGSGSGSGDMTMLVPVSYFAGADTDSFVYFYSAFGGDYPASAGFEEWSTRGPAVPAPATALLGVLAAGVYARRRR